MRCPYDTCYYFKGCDQFSNKRTPASLYQLVAPDCFGCKLISDQISCPPDWRILKKNGDYCIQRKDRLWIFSKWTYIRAWAPMGERIVSYPTAYEAYVKLESRRKAVEESKIKKAVAKEKLKLAKKIWKKENGVVCGDK